MMSMELNTELEAFFEIAEATVTYVKHCYVEELDQDTKDDVLDLIEQVLQYGVLVMDVADERYHVIDTLRQLAVVMRSQSGSGSLNKRGRPEFDVGEGQLSYLVEQGFSTKDISTMFGCSIRTIERRMKKYELSHLKSMVVSDANLDSLVRETTSLFPRCGEKTINGRLRSCSIWVPRQRIRDSLRRVDPSDAEEYYIEESTKLHHRMHCGILMDLFTGGL